MTTTSLGRRVPNDRFPHEIARKLRVAAQRSRDSFGDSPFLDNHFHTLNELADLVLAAGLEDQRLRSLSDLQAYSGGESDTWTPGEEASRFIASCGLGPATPTAAESLAELVSVSIEDLANALGSEIKRGRDGLKRVSQLEESNRAASEELKGAKDEAEGLRKELAEARKREAELMAQANHLRRALNAASNAKPRAAAKKEKKKGEEPRPVKVEGEVGIYTNTFKAAPNEWETVYEINYKDATGKLRWRRLDHTDLDRARAERAELNHTKEPATA
jgi:hypothetical protein